MVLLSYNSTRLDMTRCLASVCDFPFTSLSLSLAYFRKHSVVEGHEPRTIRQWVVHSVPRLRLDRNQATADTDATCDPSNKQTQKLLQVRRKKGAACFELGLFMVCSLAVSRQACQPTRRTYLEVSKQRLLATTWIRGKACSIG